MPLYMVSHTIDVVTAKVPLNQIMLLEAIKSRSIPTELKVRVVLPTASTVSISLWDAPSAEELHTWLNDNLQFDAQHEVHEVQEEFTFGLTTLLSSVRAAEKVAAGSRSAVDRISATAVKAGGGITRQLEVLDQRTGVLTAAESAFTKVRQAAVSTLGSVAGSNSTSTGGAQGAAGPEDVLGLGSEPVPARAAGSVAPGSTTVAASMTAGITKASSTLSWLGSTLKEQLRSTLTTTTGAPGTAAQPGFSAQQETAQPDYFPPPAYDTVVAGHAAPAYGTMPFDHMPTTTGAPARLHAPAPSGHEEDVVSLASLSTSHPVAQQPSTADTQATDAGSERSPAGTQQTSAQPSTAAQFTLEDEDVATPGAATKA